MIRRTFFIILSFLVFSVVVLALLFYFSWQSLLTPLATASNIPGSDFTINSGEPASSVAQRLQRQKLIKSAWAATLYLKVTNFENRLKPGTFRLSPNSNVSTIIDHLMAGPTDIRVTIPEGWRREQIATRLADSLGKSSGFNAVDFLTQTVALEGQLFPDTYLFSQNTSTSEVIQIFTANFSKKTSLHPGLVSDREVLILASLVEREAKLDADRPLIAGILKKRLLAGWPLQVDATVQYALDSHNCARSPLSCDWWKPVFDTSYSSPYNTYLHPDLPPGPICNPGLASIAAANTPQDSPYWYYLTGTNGQTYYAKSLSEHNLNVDKHLQP